MENKLIDMLKKGQKPVGIFYFAGNQATAEALTLSGVDYLVIDAEHGPFDVESAADIMRGVEARGGTALVRVKDSSRSSILKMLDAGARGLVIPNVQSLAEAREIVEHGKYFPKGQRGINLSRGAGYGFADHARDFEKYLRISNDRTLLLPQCETKGCLENIEAIAALDGIDGIFIGPFDLSAALGKPAQFDNPEFIAAIARIRKACQEAGKHCFTFAATIEVARQALNQGYDSVVYSTESSILVQALRKTLETLRA